MGTFSEVSKAKNKGTTIKVVQKRVNYNKVGGFSALLTLISMMASRDEVAQFSSDAITITGILVYAINVVLIIGVLKLFRFSLVPREIEIKDSSIDIKCGFNVFSIVDSAAKIIVCFDSMDEKLAKYQYNTDNPVTVYIMTGGKRMGFIGERKQIEELSIDM